MFDEPGLRRMREGRFFEDWDEFVAAERVEAADRFLGQLVDDVLALGPALDEASARAAVARCVDKFNEIDDDGWIATIEREDIGDRVYDIIKLAGFEWDDDWIGERDW